MLPHPSCTCYLYNTIKAGHGDLQPSTARDRPPDLISWVVYREDTKLKVRFKGRYSISDFFLSLTSLPLASLSYLFLLLLFLRLILCLWATSLPWSLWGCYCVTVCGDLKIQKSAHKVAQQLMVPAAQWTKFDPCDVLWELIPSSVLGSPHLQCDVWSTHSHVTSSFCLASPVQSSPLTH